MHSQVRTGGWYPSLFSPSLSPSVSKSSLSLHLSFSSKIHTRVHSKFFITINSNRYVKGQKNSQHLYQSKLLAFTCLQTCNLMLNAPHREESCTAVLRGRTRKRVRDGGQIAEFELQKIIFAVLIRLGFYFHITFTNDGEITLFVYL